MIKIEPSPSNVIALKIIESLNAQDVQLLKKVLDEKLEQEGQIGLVSDLSSMKSLTFDAIKEKISLELSLIGQIKKMERVALLCDKKFSHILYSFLNIFLPKIELKTFGSDRWQEAIEWARPKSSPVDPVVSKESL